MVVVVVDFPRGRGEGTGQPRNRPGGDPPSEGPRRPSHHGQKNYDDDDAPAATDFLFGRPSDIDHSQNKKKMKQQQLASTKKRKHHHQAWNDGPDSSTSNHHHHHHHHKSSALLLAPLGGGGVVAPTTTTSSAAKKAKREAGGPSSSTHTAAAATAAAAGGGGGGGYIEGLGFAKITKGLRLLAYVREVHDQYIIYSLPNFWSAFQMRDSFVSSSSSASSSSSSSSPPCTARVQVGQLLAVVVTHVVQETVANKGRRPGRFSTTTPRRRIQVSCDPAHVHPLSWYYSSTHSNNNNNNNTRMMMMLMKPGWIVRGSIVSREDHGWIVDLGRGQRGFLPTDQVQGPYQWIEEEDGVEAHHQETPSLPSSSAHYVHQLRVHRILDFVVGPSSTATTRPNDDDDGQSTRKKSSAPSTPPIVPLQLWSPAAMARHLMPPTLWAQCTLADLLPGMLVRVTVEAKLRNGLCVHFGGFRGAVESTHSSCHYLPLDRSSQHVEKWKAFFDRHRVLTARILAVDPPTQLLRLTLLPHLLDRSPALGPCPPGQSLPSWPLSSSSSNSSSSPDHHLVLAPVQMPKVGSVIEQAVVLRHDPGLGALLALPQRRNPTTSEPIHPPIDPDDESYLEATRVQTVYVHISNAMDPETSKAPRKNGGKEKAGSQKKTSSASFAKQFAPSTKHTVRILNCHYWIDGIASGATARSIVEAHVLTYADLVPGQVYRQVPVCGQLENGGVLVEFGQGGIIGLIPPVHLFDTATMTSDRRTKLQKVKYAVGAKVDVRVLTVDVAGKKCVATAKKALIKSDQVISSFEEVRIGQKAVGYVSKVDDQGLSVTFCNGVYGRVTARSLAADLGVENPTEDYYYGDVVYCTVLNIKTRIKGDRQPLDEEPVEMNGNGASDRGIRYYRELTLSLSKPLEEEEDEDAGDAALASTTLVDPSKTLHLAAGTVLPQRSMLVMELVPGRHKETGIVPGYAIVSIKAKYLVNGDENSTTILPNIECKLPFDQLFDEYLPECTQSAKALDELAEGSLTVGMKINRKGIMISDPRKSLSEFTSGTGKLTVVSIRPKLVALAESSPVATDDKTVILPGPDSHLFVGALVQGYVAQLDPRHGAFVRFLDGLTGLIPKRQGGLDLPLFGTVTAKVVAVDVTTTPKKILLSKIKSTRTREEPAPPDSDISTISLKAGDVVSAVEVVDFDFHRARVNILDEPYADAKLVKARIHCSMADSPIFELKPGGTSSTKFSNDQLTEFHPFHAWKSGLILRSLTVVSVEQRGRTSYVELTNRSNGDENISDEHWSTVQPGGVVSGIVSSVDRNHGVKLLIRPGVSCAVPLLELTEDLDILSNVNDNVPLGCRLEGIVMDKSVIEKRRASYALSTLKKATANSYRSSIPLVSVLGRKVGNVSQKPQRGDLVIGRIDRSFHAPSPPALMLELRGGFLGRCCLTELTDPMNWTNLFLGSQSQQLARESGSGGDVDSFDADNEASNNTHAFHEGSFFRCRVVDTIPSKPIVEVSIRASRIDGELEDDPIPRKGDTVKAFVIETTEKGCFLRLSRQVEGRVKLKDLCEGFLPDPPASFPCGRLVVGKVKDVHPGRKAARSASRATVDVDMRDSSLIEVGKSVRFEDIEVGEKYEGVVSRIEDYGVFVRIKQSKVTGLVHMSECSDNYIKNLGDLYQPGDLVKVIVVKKDNEKRQIGFSMKASHFENDDRSEHQAEEEEEVIDDGAKLDIDMADSDDENFGAQLAVALSSNDNHGDRMVEDDDEHDNEEDDEENDEDEDDIDEEILSEEPDDVKDGIEKGAEFQEMDTNIGFDWGTRPKSNSADDMLAEEGSQGDDYDEGPFAYDGSDNDNHDNDDDEDDDNDEKNKLKHKSRRKQAERRRQEREIARRESALADGRADENPETAADFDRQLAGNPNSSELWIKYMAFHLSLADVPAAREVANRAIQRIDSQQEREMLNVWCALLTLELKYGSETAFQECIERACKHNNPKHVYLRVCEILEKAPSASVAKVVERTDDMFARMCRRFKSKKKVWIAHIEYLLKNARYDEAHAVSKRALQSLPLYKHVETMSKFAQLVYEYDSPERARTLFDGLLLKYPKRLDLFFVYVDKETKHGDTSVARTLFERLVSSAESMPKLKLSDKQMKSFFKKWFAFEESHGTHENQELVKDAARRYVSQSSTAR